MIHCLTFVFVLMAGSMSPKDENLRGDLTKEEIAREGKTCVHGYRSGLKSVLYFAGNAASFNDYIGRLQKSDKLPSYTTKKVVLRLGPNKAGSPWDKAEREIATDWSVTDWVDAGHAGRRFPSGHLQIDIWLGRQIKLEEIRIPGGFEVVSGGEIEKFIHQPKHDSK